ncbi:unnamed protein product [Adineta ricciae]|uniref:Uncharacterized protein n=1 Tax=Adineta ricciae TaxID=249248 RepID=A0A816CYP8_ADIRI|nr:unnamed protein product [Adineta ricciae]
MLTVNNDENKPVDQNGSKSALIEYVRKLQDEINDRDKQIVTQVDHSCDWIRLNLSRFRYNSSRFQPNSIGFDRIRQIPCYQNSTARESSESELNGPEPTEPQ